MNIEDEVKVVCNIMNENCDKIITLRIKSFDIIIFWVEWVFLLLNIDWIPPLL